MLISTSRHVLLAALLIAPTSFAYAQDAAAPQNSAAPVVADPVKADADVATPAEAAEATAPPEIQPYESAEAAAAAATAQADADPVNEGPPPTPPAVSDAAAAQDEADADYALLYGNGQPQQDGTYNPIADPTLPEPAEVGAIWDPWEKFNRKVHTFNNFVDRNFAKPVAKAYVKVVPRVVRLGVSNFFSNLSLPVSAVNSLLQGKPGNAGRNLARFAVNTTLGLGGIVDAATDAKLTPRYEDFGQTMGAWGWQRSRYLELPLFGPRTIRDTLGMVADAPLSPVRQINDQNARLGLQGLNLVNIRAELLAIDGLAEGIEDDYALMRDTWSRRRMYQINSDRRKSDEDASLPGYLDDDTNPQAPVDVLPVTPR